MPGGRLWTSAERRKLVLMLGEGRRHGDIAVSLGRTPGAIRSEVVNLRKAGRLRPLEPGQAARGRIWTPEEDDLLLKAVAVGRGLGAIGQELGRTRGAVGARLSNLRRRGVPIPILGAGGARGIDWDDGTFARLWACERISIARIARHFGCSRRAVCDAARCRGLPPRADPYASRRGIGNDAEFRDMWTFGVSIAGLARHFGVAPGVVHVRRAALGLPPRGRGRRGLSLTAWAEAELGRKMLEAS